MNAIPEASPGRCADCGAAMPEISSFCPECGRPVGGRAVSGRDLILAGSVYLILVPAIVLLLMEPYKRDRYLRFHSYQSILFWLIGVLIATSVRVLALVLILIPAVGLLLIVLLTVAATVGWSLGLLVLTIKAAQGQLFKIPYLSAIAERQAFTVSEAHARK